MTVIDSDLLSDPEFIQFVTEKYASPDEIARFTPYLQAETERLRYDWSLHARPEQLAPVGEWIIWLLVTGRRWGKTRAAAEWLRKRALSEVGSYAICAPTYSDVRDVCVEGGQAEPANRRSGLLSVCAPGEIATYNRSLGEIRMSNGSKIKMLSADEPDRARGWGFNAAWCDEFSSWRYPATWYETLLPAVTMSDTHRFIITTTPKPNTLTKALILRAADDPSIAFVRGRTIDNEKNLGAGAVQELRRQMTVRQARQELEGELLLDVPGAIATHDQLDANTVADFPELVRCVVSVDPAVTNTAASDDTGMSVQGRGIDGDVYKLADLTCRMDVDAWATRAIGAAIEWQAGMVLYEKNQGADAIGSVLRRAARDLGVQDHELIIKDVTASKSKFDRALGLQQAIQQGRYKLVGAFPEYRSQMTEWTIDSPFSPGRIDADVHGFNELMAEGKTRPRAVFRG